MGKHCSSRSLSKRIYDGRYLYLLALPAILFFIVFKLLPLGGVVISFKDFNFYKSVFGSPWVGLTHFKRLFSNPDFPKLLRNTLTISILNLVFYFPIPILLSLMLNEVRNFKFKRAMQSIVYLPHFLSWVIVVSITSLLFSQTNGIVNMILESIGMEKYNFLQNPDVFYPMVVIQQIWKESGWGTIIILAAISGIDVQLYEAAAADGANRLKQIWHITLPGIRSTIVTLFILQVGSIMNVGFEQIYLLRNSAVSDIAEVFETYVFRIGIEGGEFSYTTAVGIFKSVVALILVIIANKVAKSLGEEGVY